MKREDLEHVLRASSRICDEPVFVVIGSQAILGTHPDASEEAIVRSIEADIYPYFAPQKSALLNVIGWGSEFHNTFGYYVDGVDETTAVLPDGWFDRIACITVDVGNGAQIRGLCVEPHDLAISKLFAGREKDFEYVAAAAKAGYVCQELLLERLANVPRISRKTREALAKHIATIYLHGALKARTDRKS